MRRILLLQQRFALYKPSSNLINTGLPEYESSLRIFPYLNHTDVSIGDKMLLDWTERGQLQRYNLLLLDIYYIILNLLY